MKQSILIVIILFLCFTNSIFAYESEVLENGGVKASAMANATSAKSGETEFFSESPASPADLQLPQLSLEYGDIAGFNNFLNLSYSQPTLRGVISGSIKYFNANTKDLGMNSAFNVNLNFSKPFTDKLFVGIGLKFLSADYFNGSGTTFGLNLGGIYNFYNPKISRKDEIVNNVKLGFSILNIGNAISQDNPIKKDSEVISTPITIKTGPGVELNLSKNIKNFTAVDFEFRKLNTLIVNLGTENIFYEKYVARLGYSINSDYQNFTFGVGYKFRIKDSDSEVDYSLVSTKENKILNYLGLDIKFGQLSNNPPQTKIDLNAEYISPVGKANYLEIKPEINANRLLKYWEVDITDANGKVIKQYQSPDLSTLKGKLNLQKIFTRLFEKEKEVPVPEKIIWDGIDSTGKNVDDGLYKVVLFAHDENLNKSEPITSNFYVKNTPPSIGIKPQFMIFSPNGLRTTDEFDLSFNTVKEDQWTAKFVDAKGITVKSYSWSGDSTQKIIWDGNDNNGNLCPDGNYDLIVDGIDLAQNSAEGKVQGITLTTAKQSVAVDSTLNEFSPKKDSPFAKTSFNTYVSDPKGLEKWKFTVYNENGDEVKTINGNDKIPANLEWDGTDNNHKVLKDDEYLYKIEAWYNSGNHPESFPKKILINTTPPEIKCKVTPALFSPNGVSENNICNFNISMKDKSTIKTWTITIYEKPENGAKTIFKKYEQKGIPANNIKWDGFSDDGRLVQSKNQYFYDIQAEDVIANKSSLTGNEIKISKELPDVDFDFEPQLFAPDDEGINNLLTINIYSYDNKKYKSWKLDIYPIRSGKRESLFMNFSGTNLPNVPIIWNGKNKDGELVESAMDYDMELTVEDVLGNIKIIDKTLNVDVLVIKTPYGLKIKISNIEFEYNKAELIGNAFKILDRVTKILNKYATYKVIIEGHTDSIGSEDYNLKLSEKRAQSVDDYLIKNGLDQPRLTVKGYGKTRPVAPNINTDGSDNPEGRAKNRRVEFLLIKPSIQLNTINSNE